MPLPKRPSLCSIADTYMTESDVDKGSYQRSRDEAVEDDLRGWYGGGRMMQQRGGYWINRNTFQDDDTDDEEVDADTNNQLDYDEDELSISERSSGSVTTTYQSTFSMAKSDDTSLMQGYFLDQGPRSRGSSSAIFGGGSQHRLKKPSPPIPPGVLLRRSMKHTASSPGPGCYNPVYSVLAKRSPYS
eukprot:TRINITY_DN10725_c0_g1_i1.p1 TRINITY_DN10725_c0_g1~~TRINITY_DN10725_c0_g1_i1.p1  ORF type:complete len:187 (+),score=42.60 TRINITY_DN10725_c0_g1_i1:301-861(+)